jgi:hypothetical protein
MTGQGVTYKTLVFTHRLKTQAVVETMSEQVPEVRIAFAEINDSLKRRLAQSVDDGWQLVSHSHSIYNGILIVSVLIKR